MINVTREYTKNIEDDMITMVDGDAQMKYSLTMMQAHDLLKKLERALNSSEIG